MPAHDDLPDEAVEAGSWAETFELGRVGYKVAEAVLREARPSLRASIEARVREQVASEIEAAGRADVEFLAGDETKLGRWRLIGAEDAYRDATRVARGES